jgi:hypothetical protein
VAKIKIKLIDILYWAAFIAADIFIFLILSLLLMGYDDSYDISKGEYWSLSSMNTTEKLIYIFYLIWIGLNTIGLVYLGYKIYKRIKNNT